MAHCDEALALIYQAIRTYQNNNDGKNPQALQLLVDMEFITPWELVCPVSPYAFGQSSFGYRGADLDNQAVADMVLAFDKQASHKGKRNVLMANGRVHRPPEKIFDSLIQKDNEIRQSIGLAIIEFNRYRVDD